MIDDDFNLLIIFYLALQKLTKSRYFENNQT